MKRFLIVVAALVGLAPAAYAQTTDAILDSLQLGAFRFAWYEANPANGLIKDRSTPGSPCSIAATGFGLSAICIGVDHAWVSRADAAARVLLTLQTFWNGPQGNGATGFIGSRGLFYHFLDMFSATRTWTSELSTIDTALLLAGMLDAREFFDGADATETQIRTLVNQIYQRVEWNFMQAPTSRRIRHKWTPETGFGTECGGQPCEWTGYNEGMILYILAFGSPTFPIPDPATSWNAWRSTYNYSTQFGQTYLIFPPLFGHQYSHCWIDFRLYNDSYMTARGLTYFENSRRATLAQRAYAIAAGISNPAKAYTDSLWGLTASDEPNGAPYPNPPYTGYSAHGAPPAQDDDGTITPTAPISSIAFAPNEVIPVIRKLWQTYKTQMWGFYGFKDAMNLLVNPDWFDTDALGIDQGPITIMIENYRTGAVWERFMQAPEVILGLQNAGFIGPLDVPLPGPGPALESLTAAPNPFAGEVTLSFRLARAGRVRLTVLDIGGRVVGRLVDGPREAGLHVATLSGADLPSGVYLARLEAANQVIERTLVRLR